MNREFLDVLGDGWEDAFLESPWVVAEDSEALNWPALVAHMRLCALPQGAVLFAQKQHSPLVYLVKQGIVRQHLVNEQGTERHLLICGPGIFIGAEEAVDGHPSNCAAVALENENLLYQMPMADFRQWMRSEPKLSHLIQLDLARKNRVLAAQLLESSSHSSTTKIIKALFRLGQRFGVTGEKGLLLDVNFTHLEMANLIGTNRVTVSRVFSFLAEQGLLQKENHRYYITSTEKLQRFLDDRLLAENGPV